MEEEILKIIYENYPRNMDSNIEAYLRTVEHGKLRSFIKTAEKNIGVWNSFLDTLRQKVTDKYEIEDWTQLFNYDACYTCRLPYSSVNNEFTTLSINVSIITKYYCMYVSKIIKADGKFSAPEIDFEIKSIPADLLFSVKETINSFFSNYKELPVYLTNKLVNDISIGNKSAREATIFDCIFTTHVW